MKIEAPRLEIACIIIQVFYVSMKHVMPSGTFSDQLVFCLEQLIVQTDDKLLMSST